MSANSATTPIPVEWSNWHQADHDLARKILEYLAALQVRGDQVDDSQLRKALAACYGAANLVGPPRYRMVISTTLHDAHEEATSLAERILAHIPYSTRAEWHADGGTGEPHDRLTLWMEADDIIKRISVRAVEREMNRASLVQTPQRKPGRKRDPVKIKIASAVDGFRRKDISWKDIPARIKKRFGRSYTVAALQKYRREYVQTAPK